MSTRFTHALCLPFAITSLGVLVGCNQPVEEPSGGGESPVVQEKDDYDPHDVPITEEQKTEVREQAAKFADAVAMVKEFRDEIQHETGSGIPEDPYKAHQALDKADLVLQWLPEIARDSDVAKEHWEVINTSANDLRTLFEQVHQNIDDKQDPNFAAVAGEIDEKLAVLTEVATAQPSGTTSEG